MNENNNPYEDWGLPKGEEDINNKNLSTNDSININNNIFTSPM